MLKNGAPDDKEISKLFRSKKKKTNIAYLKNYLYKKLLSELSHYENKDSIKREAFILNEEFNFLFKRKLFDAANKQLKKLEKIIYENDMYELQFSFLLNKNNLNFSSKVQQQILNNEKVVNQIVENLAIRYKLIFIHQNLILFNYDKGNLAKYKNKINEFENYISQILEKNSTLNRDLYHIYNNKSLIALLKGDIEAQRKAQYKALNIINKSNYYKKEHPALYASTLQNVIQNMASGAKKFSAELKNKLEELKELSKNKSIVQSRIKYYYLNSLIYVHLNLFNTEYYKMVIEECNKFDETDLSQGLKIGFQYNKILYQLFCEDFSGALDEIIKIFNDKKVNIREELFLMLSVIQIICHYEIKNYFLLDSMSRSARRKIKGRKDQDHFERTIIKGVTKIASIMDNRSRKKAFQKLYQDLQNIKEQTDTELIGFNELEIWLQHKIQNRPMAAIGKELAAK